MTCTGYDADTGRKYYVDRNTGRSYVGAPYAEYGVLTPLRATTNTAPVPPTRASTDCPRIIPKRPQKKEEEVHPKYQDGSDGPSKVLNRSKTRRAKTLGTWPPIGWGHISTMATAANQDSSDNEKDLDAADSETSEGKHKHATTPPLGEYTFDHKSLPSIPPAGSTSESLVDCEVLVRQSSPVPFLVTDLNPPRRQTVGSVGEMPRGEVNSGGTKRRRTILHRLFRLKQ